MAVLREIQFDAGIGCREMCDGALQRPSVSNGHEGAPKMIVWRTARRAIPTIRRPVVVIG